MGKVNKIKSITIVGETAHQFDQRMNNFLESDITIEQTYYTIAPKTITVDAISMTEGLYHSCLIFYHEN